MLSLLKNWKGAVEVNGTLYENIAQIPADTAFLGDVHIKLYPAQSKARGEAGNAVQAVSDTVGEHKITVKQYMTRKATDDFDFMLKWNNDKPMPLRTMQGTIEKETRGMVYMHLHGVGQKEICCMRCGRELTHPVSRHYGIGPECMKKLGIVADIEDVENIKEQLVKVEWEGWIIKSAITSDEEVVA